MCVLSDSEILRYVQEFNLIENFIQDQEEKGVVSYGLSSSGYDMRADRIFDVYCEVSIPWDVTNRSIPLGDLLLYHPVLDVKDLDLDFLERVIVPEDEVFILMPHEYALGNSIEKFNMTEDICGTILGKSTYARGGLIVNTTPAEPGWEGYLTLEYYNASPLPIAIHPGEGIAQIQFHKLSGECIKPYNKKEGKYQDQPRLPIPPSVIR